MRRFLKKAEEQPDRAPLQGIIALQSLRTRSFLDVLEANPPWFDLVVVDEAHHMRNSGTLSNNLGRLLNECAYAMLLMTATPIHLGNQNLFHLLQILDPDEFDNYDLFERRLETNQLILEAERALRVHGDLAECKERLLALARTRERSRFERNPYYQDLLIKLDQCRPERRDQLVEIQRDLSHINLLSHILTRTRKREVNEARPQRTPRVIPVRFTAAEFAFYERITDECIAWYERKGVSWAARFAALSLQRQMASCLPAFLRHNRDPRWESDLGPVDEDLSVITPEDWGLDEEISSITLREARSRLAEEASFQRILREYEPGAGVDSKYVALRDELAALNRAEPGRKLIIFSYFKKTLAYLDERLTEDGYRCVVLTGDVPSRPSDPEHDERAKRLQAFREDPDVQILLSSEVGSEGLDFQFCHILVNYDLPWNPMVVEQRIGRLDRLGQQSERILILNFSVRGTIEEEILGRLYQRIGIFEGSIGDLEPILGEEIRQLTDELLRSRLTDAERVELIEERARVLVRKKLDSEKLEEESRKFLGQDEFFNDEISRVQEFRRYLSPEELQVLVADYLRAEHPKCTLQEARHKGCYWLTVTTGLQQVVRRKALKDPAVLEFLLRSDSGGLLVTFDSNAACDVPSATLLSSQHPLVRSIVAYYEDHPDQMQPVSKLQVVCPTVNPTDYIFELRLFEVTGAEQGRYLDAIFVPVDAGPPLEPDASDLLLSRMLVDGRDWPEELEAFGLSALESWRSSIHAEVDRRLTERRSTLQKRNGALVESRLASLEASYTARKTKHQSLLERAVSEGKKENYVRMLRGGLRNLETEFERQVIDLERGRRLELQLQRFALGIVRVHADEGELE